MFGKVNKIFIFVLDFMNSVVLGMFGINNLINVKVCIVLDILEYIFKDRIFFCICIKRKNFLSFVKKVKKKKEKEIDRCYYFFYLMLYNSKYKKIKKIIFYM